MLKLKLQYFDHLMRTPKHWKRRKWWRNWQYEHYFSSVQLLSRVWLFATPRTAAPQASLSITNSRSLPKLMSVELVMPSIITYSVVPFSSCPQSFPASGSFPISQFFASGGQSIGISASASVLPINIQDWSPLGWAGWISLQSKGLSSLLQHHSSKASILRCSVFLIFLQKPCIRDSKRDTDV